MSWTPGVFGSVPYVYCDKCGTRRGVFRSDRAFYSWVENQKRAPGWQGGLSTIDGTRWDLCENCSAGRTYTPNEIAGAFARDAPDAK